MSDEQKVQDELTPEESLTTEQENQGDAADNGPEAELAKALDEVAQVKDQMLRVQAEMQNIRRRADADVEKAHKFGVEKFANEMLGVVDNLERAIAACSAEDDATKALREGVELTLTGLLSGLAKFKVEVVNPKGEAFNPELHQAITMITVPGSDANTVVEVMQKGYTLAGRLLRPAMVVVNKGN